MQSIRRQIKRGHAVLALNHVTKSLELVQKKGTSRDVWNNAVHDRAQASEQEYMDNITLPLSQKEIIESEERRVFRAPLRAKKPKRNNRKKERIK